VIYGAASGIGAAIAQRFAAEGATVIAVDIDPERGKPVQEELDIEVRQGDVSDETSVRSLFDYVHDHWGGLDILVNSAGIARIGDILEDVKPADFDDVISVNLRGPFLTMKYAIPLMRARGGGSIVNIASINSFVARTGNLAYIASKGGVLMLTKAAALDYADKGIRVNAVAPGTIDTPILDGLTPEMRANIVDLHPMGRIGRPQDVAAVALFLASDESAWVTGSSYLVDGGRLAV